MSFSAVSQSTWQADGVAFAVTSTQGKVFVGGSFTAVRPPEGSTGTPRQSPALVVLDADTGAPDACQISVVMAGGTPVVRALTTSPDGSTVYLGGNFTSLNGVQATRVGAIDVATCTVHPLSTVSSSFVNGLAATSDTLYLAGQFTTVSGQPRRSFAAVDSSTGAVRPWVADADLPGRAIAVSPDRTRVALGGEFFAVNGAHSHSIAVVDATTGANVRTYPTSFTEKRSATKSIVSDGTSFYVGNEGTGNGVFDGRIAIDWTTLDQRWRDTCLGATQAVLPYNGVLYVATHAHNCSSMQRFPDGARHFFLAQSTADGSLRGWFPQGNDGIGEHIGPRGLALAQGRSGQYLYAVGEFTRINGSPQQSITRFGTEDTAPLATPTLTASALSGGGVQLRVSTVVDNDDDTLTYQIFRNGSTTPMWTGRSTSWFWSKPQITVTDTDVAAGKTHSYRVQASDGTNVSALSSTVTVTTASKPTLDYASQVVADGAQLYWRFDEASGRTEWNQGVDSPSAPAGLLEGGVSLGTKGAFGTDRAATFDGFNDYARTDQLRLAPQSYSLETWIKTTTTKGGKIIGFSDSRPRTDNNASITAVLQDRALYMDGKGRLNFAVNQAHPKVLRTPRAYNDGHWHHVVATQGDGTGMRLYVDGASVLSNSVDKAQTPYWGVWKVGGDSLLGWPHRPSSDYFAGSIDETAVYEGIVLPAATVATHFQLSGLSTVVNAAPTSRYGAAVFASDPLFYWPLDSRSRTVKDKAIYAKVPATASKTVGTYASGAVGHAVAIKAKSSSSVVSKDPLEMDADASVELWFKTKSTKGGSLATFEAQPGDDASKVDDLVYLSKKGAVTFGRNQDAPVTVHSKDGLNDGSWHQVVATGDASSMSLYVDGKQVASSAATPAAGFAGYWRLGGRAPAGWASATTDYFAGSVDEVAVYSRALAADEVAAHFTSR